MADSTDTTIPDPIVAPAVAEALAANGVPTPIENPISVEDFCKRTSVTDKRVETLGAFYKSELAAGRTFDLSSYYASRLSVF